MEAMALVPRFGLEVLDQAQEVHIAVASHVCHVPILPLSTPEKQIAYTRFFALAGCSGPTRTPAWQAGWEGAPRVPGGGVRWEPPAPCEKRLGRTISE